MLGFNPKYGKLIGLGFVIMVVGIFLMVNSQKRMDPQGSSRQLPGIRENFPPPFYLSVVSGPSASMPTTLDSVMAAVTVQWNSNPESDLAGYRLYHGPASGAYTEQMPTTSTLVTVANMTPGTTKHFSVTAVNTAGFESALAPDMTYAVPAAATPPPVSTPLPTSPPTPTVAPTAIPTAPPTPTPAPTSSPASGITLTPTAITFTGIVGGPWPANQSIRVTTSNGGSWTSQDTSPWFDTSPNNQGPSGAFCILKPHTNGMTAGTYFQNLTFKSPGLPNKVVVVKLVLTATVSSPTPTCTPCRCP